MHMDSKDFHFSSLKSCTSKKSEKLEFKGQMTSENPLNWER